MKDLSYQQDDQNFRRIIYGLLFRKKLAILTGTLLLALTYSVAVSETQPLRHVTNTPGSIEQTSTVNTQLDAAQASAETQPLPANQSMNAEINHSSNGSMEVRVNGETILSRTL